METEIIVVDPAIKKDIRPEEVGFPYTPQTQSDDTSDQFSTTDYLTMNHNDVFNLTNFSDTGKINNSYSISSIADYTNDSLNYGITELKSIDDYYTVEDDNDAFLTLDVNNYYTFAQAFDIAWDYAFYYGSELFLTYDTGGAFSLEDYELSLHIVSVNSTDGNPNMTDIITNCTSNAFKQGATYNDVGGFQFFDFTDVRLTKGTYYFVANLSQIDADDAPRHFLWAKNDHVSDGVDGGKTLYRSTGFPGQWSTPRLYDFTLINSLYPVDSNNNSIIFTGTDEIDLKDNGVSISTTTSSISSIGTHELTSNTSVQITFNNSYTFAKTFSGNDVYAVFSATNASYWSHSIDWDINWTSSSIDITPYTNLDRYQVVFTPTDWHDTIFTFYYNETNTLTGSRETEGYRVDLGTNNSAGNWLFSTTSPNYLSDLVLLDDTTPTERFFLGYWVGGATDSTGYVGSKIVANTLVQGDGAGTPYNETTGILNYTLYDINGNIVPFKSSLPANLIYTDSTYYTLSGITQVSAGFYTPEIYFDPSASGSDLPGFWTAAVLWQNGTEVGFYSQRIVVQTQTELVLEWEEEPSNNNWITTDISRKGLDSILVRGSYYNISEPYTTGTKNLIPSATVSYTVHNATWNKNDVFNDYAPDYNTSILVDANIDVGTYTVDFLGTGAFLENNSTSFTLTVFYELSLVPEYTNYQTNYTNKVVYYLNLYDVTASSNLSLTPDDMTFTIANGTDFPLASPVDYNFTYQASTEQWVLNISTSTNDLYTGYYSVEISIYLNNYQANYSEVYVSDVYTFEITSPPTEVLKTGDATTIYVYHDATFSFRFQDTNHSTYLLGANFVASANESNIDFSYNIIGDTYYVTVTNNNPAVNSIAIYVDVSLSNYESKIGFLLGEISVLTIQTSLTEDTTPTEVYVGYNTSIIVQFNDITHAELIDVGTGTFVSITSNSSSFTDLGYVYIGSGRYNVSFINNDYTLEGINITITIGKTGYENASISFQIQVLSISTDSMLVDIADQDITIYFDEGTSIEILYWDNISFVNITDPQVSFSGNLTVIPSYSFLDNITTITILTISDLGYYELIITLEKPGYEPQIITVYILVQERQTSVDSDYTDITFYADQTDHVLLNYTDELDLVEILVATVDIDFAEDNSTLIVQDYFIITLIEVGSFYEITFDPIEINATGYVFVFNITLSKYGYETNFIIITVTINIHPTAIDPTSQDQDSVYTDEDGEFTIIYETIEDTFISGADLSYTLINGTSAEIEDVVLTQILDAYVVYVYINSSIVPVKSYLIELTFYKHGFENQTWIITITVASHPTAIDPTSQDEDNIYADENAEFTIIYETEEGDFISGAEFDYNIINGTTAEILSVIYTQSIDSYLIYVYFDESLIAGKNFSIELIFFKHGFDNQSWIINIGVYEKITHEISVEIVGDMRQLTTIQFRVTLNSSDLDLLTALSFDNIKFFSTPDGDFVVITYVFTFANGTTIEYSIQAELQQIQPGHYVALTSEILVPWRVTNVSYSALYTPTSQSVIASEETISQSTEIKSAKFTNLIAYLFSEYTPYMAAALAVIAAVFISLTIYFAIVRPRKQRRTAKKRGYLDKISKILTSVISMRKVIIVHTETGLPIYEWDLGGDISVDSSLVTGFLQAVSGMGSEISGGQTGAIKKLDYGQFVVSSASKDCICAYLFSTSEVSIDVETGLSNFVEWFEKRFQSVLHEWGGVTDEFTTNSRQIIDTLSEELFIWTLHPLSINTLKEKEAQKLNTFSQKIFNFIKDYKEVTISVALEYFNKTPLEETLSTLFNMIDEKYLLRMRLR
ncbi:MAG: hypothetical protein KAU62_18375 [Candidatus Heimdallarchaeota archaeon]|nr:hypothetical protein [Candidatus Heimdallarchaeota archaeon]MCK4613130.1 hypothetical protein [Candidatus Heimdallarchaeota archaeon]